MTAPTTYEHTDADGTHVLLESGVVPGVVYVQVGDPFEGPGALVPARDLLRFALAANGITSDVSKWDAQPTNPDCGRCGRETDTDDDHWFVCRSCRLAYDPHNLAAVLTCEDDDGLNHSTCAGTGRDLCWWCGTRPVLRRTCKRCRGTGLVPKEDQP